METVHWEKFDDNFVEIAFKGSYGEYIKFDFSGLYFGGYWRTIIIRSFLTDKFNLELELIKNKNIRAATRTGYRDFPIIAKRAYPE